jgi:hypothetical protein
MRVTLLKQKLTQRGDPAHGLKPVLVEWFQWALWKD